MTSFVFAYGSNMCSGRFRDYQVTPISPGRAAHLEGFALNFNKRSTDGSGKATVSQSASSSVWGVLYEIPTADLAKLDDGERGYIRESATVLVENRPIEAWLYIARQPDATLGLLPYSWYKRFIVEGAREHMLRGDYIAHLEAIEDLIDSDQVRHSQRMALLCSGSDADPYNQTS